MQSVIIDSNSKEKSNLRLTRNKNKKASKKSKTQHKKNHFWKLKNSLSAIMNVAKVRATNTDN